MITPRAPQRPLSGKVRGNNSSAREKCQSRFVTALRNESGSQKPGELLQPTLALRYKGEGGVALKKIQTTHQAVPKGTGI